MLKDPLFQCRALLEKVMDKHHDDTMSDAHGVPFTSQLDMELHRAWKEQKSGQQFTEAEEQDLRTMLEVRGLPAPPSYDDEPEEIIPFDGDQTFDDF